VGGEREKNFTKEKGDTRRTHQNQAKILNEPKKRQSEERRAVASEAMIKED